MNIVTQIDLLAASIADVFPHEANSPHKLPSKLLTSLLKSCLMSSSSRVLHLIEGNPFKLHVTGSYPIPPSKGFQRFGYYKQKLQGCFRDVPRSDGDILDIRRV
jgi:hypothetical protein